MYVKAIEYAGFDTAHDAETTSGSVTLVAADTRMNIPLTVPRYIDMTKARHQLLVLAHALHEAKRLPVFRGKGALQFAPGLLPTELQAQA